MTNEEHGKEINKPLVKPLSITAGIIGLIQGITWTVFSVLCICCYYDSIQVDPITTTNVEYYKLIYYIFLNGNGIQDANLIITPKEFSIFIWFYLFFSAIWSIFSGAIIWAMIHDQWQLTKSLFGGWSITTFLVSIVDVILTGLIIGDYLQINNRSTEILVTYGIVMSIAARGYILLIINVIFAAIMAKYTINIILKGNDDNLIPIIHGYESSGTNPPWFQEDVKNFWANNDNTPTPDYNNYGFQRSQSFFNVPTTSENNYTVPPTVHNSSNHQSLPNLPQQNVSQKPTSFSEAIAQKTATIGKNRGRSPLSYIRPPIIPDPDYTPPNSPNELRSVLKSRSNYNSPF